MSSTPGSGFRWDMEKAHSNFVKHGIQFEQVCEVFFDPFVQLLDATTEDEARETALGLTKTGHYCLSFMRFVRVRSLQSSQRGRL